MTTKDKIQEILSAVIQIDSIEIIDDSAKHAGHAGAIESGGGHFVLKIVSPDFAGKTLVQRHRMIYAALETEMKSSIHALAIKALTPEE